MPWASSGVAVATDAEVSLVSHIHTTRGCFEAHNDSQHHGHAHWLAE